MATGPLLSLLTADSGTVGQDIVLAMTAAFVAAYLGTLVKLPAMVGFLAAGVLIGPSGLRLVTDAHSIDLMAEISAVFLLFTVGIKFSIRELWEMRGIVFLAGPAQVIVTLLAGALCLVFAMEGFASAAFVGALLALSSTAVVLKVLEERGQTGSAAGRFTIGVLLFQDVAAILMILLLPMLGGGQEASALRFLMIVGQSFLIIAVIFVASRFVLPFLFQRVVETRSRELFSLATIVAALGTAYTAGLAGVSVALGAFLAGIVVSESDYSRQILADVTPVRDTLSSLFFVSIGLLVDPDVWAGHWPLIAVLAAATLLLKAVLAAGVGALFGFGLGTSIAGGLWLAQVGEFSFILARKGMPLGLIDQHAFDLFIAVSVITMALTPFMILGTPRFLALLERSPKLRERLKRKAKADTGVAEAGTGIAAMNEHVIIAGFGESGRNVARMLRAGEIPFAIIELNPHTVAEERAAGEQIFYGDGGRVEVLQHVGIERARALVVTLPDPAAAEGIVSQARRMNPLLHIVVRTRFLREIPRLIKLGADMVVPEEFETSLELGAQALEAMGASEWGVFQQKHAIRARRYAMFTNTHDKGEDARRAVPLAALFGAGLTSLVLPPTTRAAGKTLAELDLRRKTGASVLAVARGDELVRNPGPETQLAAGDVVYLFGSQEEVDQAGMMLGETFLPSSRLTRALARPALTKRLMPRESSGFSAAKGEP